MKFQFLFAGIVAAGVAVSGCGQMQQAQNAKLEEKIDNLTKALEKHETDEAARIAELKAELAKIDAKVGQGSRGPQQPDLEKEKEAAQRLGEINKVVTEGNYEEAQKLLPEFMQKYSGTRAANAARSMAAEIAVFGKDAPKELKVQKWLSGKPVSLEGSKPTVLVFWEYWCPHCKREVPNLEKLYDEYKDKGLKMAGLTRMSRNVTEEDIQKFVKENNLTYSIAKESGEMASYFNVSGIPAAAIVKDGKVVWRGHPARIPQDKLKEWLM